MNLFFHKKKSFSSPSKLSSWSPVGAIGSIALLFLVACTDYVQDIEDQRDEWREELAKAESPSESDGTTSSSKEGSSISSSAGVSSSSKISDNELIESCSSIINESSSSSIAYNPHCKTDTEDNCTYGTLNDDRDGQVYKTVVIGDQIWMAENLNYETKNSYCYNDDKANCTKYGRLYTWGAAMDSAGIFNTRSKGCGYGKTCTVGSSSVTSIRGICPEGWHLPLQSEWQTLFSLIGDGAAGAWLKSTTGWVSGKYGRDAVAFSALPAGYRNSDGKYIGEGFNAYFWRSTEYNTYKAYYISLDYNSNSPHQDNDYKTKGFSVRCLKKVITITSSSGISEDSSSSSENGSSSLSSSIASSCSSGTTTTSSSNIKQTSSSAKESWAYLNPAISYGEMTDDRDGQVYKTVAIGEQEWMAENLNFETRNGYCYNDSVSYCSKYGRLYRWSTAMDSAGTWTANGKGCGYNKTCSPTYPVRGVCPEGWHLPSIAEYETLFTAVGGSSTAGRTLKSSSGWNSNGNGTNTFGFSVLPAGTRNNGGNFFHEGNDIDFWTATENNGNEAFDIGLYYDFENASANNNNKLLGFSVRCLKDDPNNIVESSSSENATSSASKESWAYLNSSYSYGEMTDERDGQIYKTIEIQGNIWMAENLNFEIENSYCYNNNTTYCSRYGRLYIWPTAMDSAGVYSSDGSGCGNKTCSPNYPARGICPEGWHLPSSSEWYNLVDPSPGLGGAVMLSAISASYTGYGVPGMPMSFDNDNDNALFWSSTNGPSDGYASYIFFSNDYGRLEAENKYYAFPVRCVKDD